MPAFITVEEKCLVLNDWSTQPAAESIPNKRGAGNLGIRVIVEPIVRGKSPGTVKLKTRAVPTVRARLGHQVDLGTRRAALVCVAIRRRNPEFFNRLRVEPQNRTRSDVASIGIQLTDHQAVCTGWCVHVGSYRVVDINPGQCNV